MSAARIEPNGIVNLHSVAVSKYRRGSIAERPMRSGYESGRFESSTGLSPLRIRRGVAYLGPNREGKGTGAKPLRVQSPLNVYVRVI